MLVEIDLDLLIMKAAGMAIDDEWRHESVSLVKALQALVGDDYNLTQRLRQQVKEYKKLTMWRE
jgi:hypothetical protein